MADLDLEELILYNDAHWVPGHISRIQTSAEQYGYICQIPIPQGASVATLQIRVHRGAVSAAIVAADMCTVLSENEFSIFDEDTRSITIPSEGYCIIIRNFTAGGSEFSIESLGFFEAARFPANRSTLEAQSSENVVAERWAMAPDDETNWATIPRFKEYAGNIGASLVELFGGKQINRVLSLCCGHGIFEQTVLQMLNYGWCDAIDISQGALDQARKAATAAGIANVSYMCQDANELALSCQYDLVYAAGVHHLSELERAFAEISRSLNPGGAFVMYEYIGPNRCQPTARQLQAINACIQLIPEKYRVRVSAQRRLGVSGPFDAYRLMQAKAEHSGLLSTDPTFSRFFWNEYIPMSEAEWIKIDPSESVRSADIVPVLKQYFSSVEVQPQGGSVLQFTLHELSRNFYGNDKETQDLLDMLLQIEKVLMEHDSDIPINYAIILARNSV